MTSPKTRLENVLRRIITSDPVTVDDCVDFLKQEIELAVKEFMKAEGAAALNSLQASVRDVQESVEKHISGLTGELKTGEKMVISIPSEIEAKIKSSGVDVMSALKSIESKFKVVRILPEFEKQAPEFTGDKTTTAIEVTR